MLWLVKTDTVFGEPTRAVIKLALGLCGSMKSLPSVFCHHQLMLQQPAPEVRHKPETSSFYNTVLESHDGLILSTQGDSTTKRSSPSQTKLIKTHLFQRIFIITLQTFSVALFNCY